jgi:hypothetical protein
MLLRDRIRTGDETNYWPLQVVIDTLAAAHNVPLRCISTRHAPNLFDRPTEFGTEIRKHFRSSEEFVAALAEVAASPAAGLARIKEERKRWDDIFGIDPFLQWIIFPSFSPPLFVLLRENKAWSIWETIWCLNYVIQDTSRDRDITAPLAYGSPFDDKLQVAAVRHTPSDLMIFAGPVWRPWSLEVNERERQEESRAIIRHLLDILPEPRLFMEGVSHDRILRNVLSRAPVDTQDLRGRTESVVRALGTVLETDCPEFPLTAREYEALALHALILTETDTPGSRSPGTLRKIQLPSGEHTDERPAKTGTLLLRVQQPARGVDGEVQLTTSVVPQETAQAADPDTEYEQRYHGVYDRTNVNCSVYFLEQINLLRLWLQSVYLARPIRETVSSKPVPSPPDPPQVLDRLSRRLMLLFAADACHIYQYDTIERQLIRRGTFLRYPEKSGDRQKVADQIREAGKNPGLRRQSIRYRCIDTGAIQFRANPVEDELLADEGEMPPRHVLVIPLKIHDRIWGAIEIQALHPYQLLESSIRWANELTRAITPVIYDRLLLQKLSEMNNILLSDLPAEEKYELILRDLAGLLMASSGALYLQHQRRTSEYECYATFGRPLGGGTTLPGYASDDPHSVSAGLLRKKDGRDMAWVTGPIGIPPFGEEWLRKDKNALLEVDGHAHIAIFSLLDSQGNPFGSITITSKDREGFGKAWTNLIRFLSKHVGVLVESIKKNVDQQDARREYEAHAVKTRVDRVIGGVQTITEVLKPFYDDDRLAGHLERYLRKTAVSSEDLEVADALRTVFRRPLQRPAGDTNPRTQADARTQIWIGKVLDDLEQHAADLRTSAVYISGGDNNEHPAYANPASWDGTWADVRLCVLSALKPLSAQHDPPISIPPVEALASDLKVRMPSTQLQEILNNMIDNAYKYNRVPKTAPILGCRVDYSKNTVDIIISNLAPPLSPKEEKNIGRPRFRSEYAKGRNSDGVGLGVAFCSAEARRWGAVFSYPHIAEQSNRETSSGLVWHRARLHFPAGIVHIEESASSAWRSHGNR